MKRAWLGLLLGQAPGSVVQSAAAQAEVEQEQLLVPVVDLRAAERECSGHQRLGPAQAMLCEVSMLRQADPVAGDLMVEEVRQTRVSGARLVLVVP